MNDARPDDVEFVGHVVANRFRTLRLLGAGGMGAVYEAEDGPGGVHVALKRLRPEFMRDQDVVRRFVQEGQTASQIVHPNIVSIMASGQDREDGSLFIVQEFLNGIDLRQRLTGGRRIAPREAVGIIIPIIDGLATAHSHGIVHRDIKPANIFLATGPSGEVIPKLIDFGVSKVLGPIGSGLSKTRTGIAVGTPHYMSPEQISGDKSLDEGSDVWAVGVVLYLMLAGQHPFKAESIPKTLLKIMTEHPQRLDQFLPDVSPQLANAVSNALQIKRKLRHPSMTAFLEVLLACPLPADPASQRPAAPNQGGAVKGPKKPASDFGATVFNAGMANTHAPQADRFQSRETTDVGALEVAKPQNPASQMMGAPADPQRMSGVPANALSDPMNSRQSLVSPERISDPGRAAHRVRQSLPSSQPRESVVGHALNVPNPPQPPVAAPRNRWLEALVVVLFVSVATLVAMRFRARSVTSTAAIARPAFVTTSAVPAIQPPTTSISLLPSAMPATAAPGVTADASNGL